MKFWFQLTPSFPLKNFNISCRTWYALCRFCSDVQVTFFEGCEKSRITDQHQTRSAREAKTALQLNNNFIYEYMRSFVNLSIFTLMPTTCMLFCVSSFMMMVMLFDGITFQSISYSSTHRPNTFRYSWNFISYRLTHACVRIKVIIINESDNNAHF